MIGGSRPGTVLVLALAFTATALAGPAAGLVTAAAVTAARGAFRRAALRRYRAAVRSAAEDVLAAVAAELDAGASPDSALRAALVAADDLPARPGTARLSAGRSSAGRRAAGRPALIALRDLRRHLAGAEEHPEKQAEDTEGALARCEAEPLRRLAVAYQVCRVAGVRLAPVSAMLADTARADAVRAGELDAALAGPRSSGRLVAGLPLVGLALGALAGARPLEVLLTTPLGAACLTLGVLLDLAGLRWLRRIADRVEHRAESWGEASAELLADDRMEPIIYRRTDRYGADRWWSTDLDHQSDLVGSSGPVTSSRGPRPSKPSIPSKSSSPPRSSRRSPKSSPYRSSHRSSGSAAAYRDQLLADLPLALDLLAACLRAGGSTPSSLEIVGAATPGPAGAELRAAGRALRTGATARQACERLVAAGTSPGAVDRMVDRMAERLAALEGPWSGQARRLRARRAAARRRRGRVVVAVAAALGRTEMSGARLAATLVRIADRARQEAHAATIAAARRAGVAAVAPLGLCFLPAFLLLGVAPVIIGSVPRVLPA